MAIIPLSALQTAARPVPGPREPTTAYVIGYAKPPKHSQFKKGQSGNPGGRPKSAKGLNTIVRDVMLAKVAVRTGSGETRMSRIEALVMKKVELATKGNLRALEQLLRLFSTAVPEQSPQPGPEVHAEPTAADEAILDQLFADMRDQIAARSGGTRDE